MASLAVSQSQDLPRHAHVSSMTALLALPLPLLMDLNRQIISLLENSERESITFYQVVNFPLFIRQSILILLAYIIS